MTAILDRVTPEITRDANGNWPSMRIVPMDEVLRAESCDALSHQGDVEDVLQGKVHDLGYPALVESIRTWGLAKGYEPSYACGYVSEGHHRIAALRELGAQWCPVNDGYDPFESWVAPDGSKPGACAHGCNNCSRVL